MPSEHSLSFYPGGEFGEACRVCGCTEWTSCYDEEYDRCYQVEPDLCSACAIGAAASERPSARQKPARNPGFSRNTRHESRNTAF